jgi:prepilin-type N-terminal cleavage/methylation domain-containing protein
MKNDRQGFTLIELLIVVVIIGVLASIAIPKFANTKGKAVVASMKSDLRNLAGVQEAWWVDNRAYYGGLVPAAALPFRPSKGVVITIVSATSSGWSATATAPGFATETCAIYYGNAAPVAPASADGILACA